MRIRVRNKITGETGTVSQEFYNPNKYELLQENKSTTPVKESVQENPSLTEKIGGFATNLAKPFIRTGQNIADAGLLTTQLAGVKATEKIAPEFSRKIAEIGRASCRERV